jgi:hypothetical protein
MPRDINVLKKKDPKDSIYPLLPAVIIQPETSSLWDLGLRMCADEHAVTRENPTPFL